mmetsp:Transcript_7909/g.29271  ORF Transcript_7909/g.29271 Transcript_7909/m.29271 type:complete len:83 (+) Transcript_7909:80-328(+)
MHPVLDVHSHASCAEQIRALQRCHERAPLGRFVGACNAHKRALDACFRAEKVARRAANKQTADLHKRTRARPERTDGARRSE